MNDQCIEEPRGDLSVDWLRERVAAQFLEGPNDIPML